MKPSILFVILALAGFAGCSDSRQSATKHVIYEVSMDASSSTFVLKGEYRAADGNMVAVDQDTPWRKELTDVPSGFKASFKGYLFNVSTKSIAGTISMKVVDADNTARVITNKHLTLNQYNENGYTAAELKQATAFSFAE